MGLAYSAAVQDCPQIVVECVNWLFGRGLSIGCGLPWNVPNDWKVLSREDLIARIKVTLNGEMDSPSIDTSDIRRYLDILAERTTPDWSSRFITTNWDYLLQREIHLLELEVQPTWMINNHVYHLNGTVEEQKDDSNRSPFLLEEDPPEVRCFTPEANIAYNAMLWDQMFVVIGMSFECQTDKVLLSALSEARDEMPIGLSEWLVLNPDPVALKRSCEAISSVLPQARVRAIEDDFRGWLTSGLAELATSGVLSPP